MKRSNPPALAGGSSVYADTERRWETNPSRSAADNFPSNSLGLRQSVCSTSPISKHPEKCMLNPTWPNARAQECSSQEQPLPDTLRNRCTACLECDQSGLNGRWTCPYPECSIDAAPRKETGRVCCLGRVSWRDALSPLDFLRTKSISAKSDQALSNWCELTPPKAPNSTSSCRGSWTLTRGENALEG